MNFLYNNNLNTYYSITIKQVAESDTKLFSDS